jgi:hypothetical protein
MLSAIDKNPATLETGLKGQLEELIFKPLRDSQPPPDPPRVIIIDGLDEVEPDQTKATEEDVHLEILKVLAQADADPALLLRILVVSRPERAIREVFGGEAKS